LQKQIDQLDTTKPNLTKIREIANEYGKNQETAMQLWKHGGTYSRLLSLLIMDVKAIDNGYIETMIQDIEAPDKQDQRQLNDWMIAHVLMKKASLKKEAGNWISAKSIIKQRIFWSIQTRTIKAENQEMNVQLLEALEQKMASANEMVQEPMK
jgi:3-methyladenine DNA glycosylase AlkD